MEKKRLIKVIVVACVFATVGAIAAPAQSSSRLTLSDLSSGPSIAGAGIMLGEPSGLTAKLWFVQTGFGVDAAVAWSFSNDSSLYLHANGLFHLAAIETPQGRYLAPYIGLGVKTKFSSEGYLGLRVPVGVSFMPLTNFPLEIFAELAPGLGLLPDTTPDFGAAIGARFYVAL